MATTNPADEAKALLDRARRAAGSWDAVGPIGRGTHPSRDDSSSTEPPRFLPVHVVADVSPVMAEPIEIALPNGRVVRVRPGFDPAMLERVLALAAEEMPC